MKVQTNIIQLATLLINKLFIIKEIIDKFCVKELIKLFLKKFWKCEIYIIRKLRKTIISTQLYN